MFSGIIARARRAFNSAMGSVLGRLAVGMLFLVAAAFGVAALTLALIERFGTQSAYWMLAIGFALIGGLVAALLSAKEDEAAAEAEAQAAAPGAVAGNLMSPENALAAVTTLVPMLMRPSSAATALGVVRFSIRNLPLLLLLALILVLVFPFEKMQPVRDVPAEAPPV